MFVLFSSTALRPFWLCVLLLMLSGCATHLPRSPLNLSDSEIHQLGMAMDAFLIQKFPIVTEPSLNQAVEEIGRRVASACPHKVRKFRILNEPTIVNALTGEGGYIYIFTGMLELAETKDELAAVLAHEVAHACQDHLLKKRARIEMGQQIQKFVFDLAPLGSAAAQGSLGPGLGIVTDKIVGDLASEIAQEVAVMMTAYERVEESEADRLAISYMRNAGYQPAAILSLLAKLERIDSGNGFGNTLQMDSTHAPANTRLEDLRSWLGQGPS